VVGRAKREFEACQQQQLLNRLYSDPKGFWNTYKGKGPTRLPATLEECTAKFRALFGAAPEGEGLQALPRAPASAEDIARAADLNAPITGGEVSWALGKMMRNKAAIGAPAEFFSEAWVVTEDERGKLQQQYVLEGVLTQLFNMVLFGAYPEAWRTSALSPVPKNRADTASLDGFRGIAVGEVLPKIYALILNARLDAWAEARPGTRARGQAGFRSGRGTPDNALVLRHLIDSAAGRQAPLYVAFIDFEKAYDKVCRGLMWRVLEGMGVHGAMLGTLRDMYASVRLQVRAGGELGEPFASHVGVKQGCPLSPLLFGLFMDRLEPWLEAQCPTEGAALAGQLVRALLYADDVALVATSPGGLQSLLNALDRFCQDNGMVVNRKKSQVVVFGSRFPGGARAPRSWCCGALELERVPGYLYLGLWFADDSTPASRRPLRGALPSAVAKAQGVMNHMLARAQALKLSNTNALGHLFDALVKSVACSGCEVWAVDTLVGPAKSGKWGTGEAETKLQYAFLQRVWGVGKSTPRTPLLLEAGRTPLAVFWLRMAVKIWNKALARPADDLLGQAVREGASARAPGSWARALTDALGYLGLSWLGADGEPCAVDRAEATRAAEDRWLAEYRKPLPGPADVWAQGPRAVRAAPNDYSTGFRALVYTSWFQTEGGWRRRESAAFHLNERGQIEAVMRFRLGAHRLAVTEGRFGSNRRDRNERLCQCCKQGVEDELHLFECPAYEGLRARYPRLCATPAGGWTDADFRARMKATTKERWMELAGFLLGCYKLRDRILLSPPEA
jgi:hypothetical protein